MKKETGRIEAFSDGVFAIAITLLVLDLGVPSPGRFAETLLADWTSYLAYLAAFLTIASIWLHHHSVFQHIARVGPAVLLFNLLLLLGVSLVPWPTSLIAAAIRDGSRSDEVAAIAVYTITSVLVSIAWAGIGFSLSRHPEWLLHPDDARWMRVTGYQAALAAVPSLVAAAVSPFAPLVSLLIFLLVPLYFILVTTIRPAPGAHGTAETR
ncbi:hypothetical protein A0130_15060 [Leifsonia xyli]|uniref:TMEM175 family protein n=1 Tax=Leifsonia xyli TaxID=1575 RepID=UPI0007CDACE5|nr:hypothetical protein A0130_15060 [Leifsonia xyli]